MVAKGKLVAWAGSPRSDGSWWNGGIADPPPNESVAESGRLDAIKKKQGALLSVFGSGGRLFEVQPWNGSAPIKCNPRIKSIDFSDGKWTDTCDFTIQMEADTVWFGNVDGGGGPGDLEPEESWSFEVESADTRSYRVSHTVSSTQKAKFDDNGNVVQKGWEIARGVVLPKTGTPPTSDMLPPVAQSNYLASNYSRSQNVDEAGGKFSVTENWTYTYGQRYIEEFSVNCRTQEGSGHVSVEGTITGYVEPDPLLDPLVFSARKYARAEQAWNQDILPNLLMRAQNYSGLSLNPIPLNKTVGYGPIKGTITYNYEFDNRPANMIPGSISETITIQQQNPADVIAQLVVLGRPQGPVIQPIGTVTAKVRSVSMEVAMQPWVYGSPMPLAPNVTSILAEFWPGGWLTKDEEVWTPRTGRYSRNVTWTYE